MKITIRQTLFYLLMLVSLPLSAQSIHFEFESADEYTQELVSTLQDLKVFDGLTAFAESNFKLNDEIYFSFYHGDSLFFDAKANKVFIPYSFLVELNEGLSNRYPQQPLVRDDIFAAAIEQLLWFEFGRVLVSQYALPITGTEEIALDEFAVTMLLQFSARAQDYLLDSAEAYLLVDDAKSVLDSSDTSQTLSLDEQRYFRIVCIVLGKDYEPHEELVDDIAWNADQLAQCEERFYSRLKIWYDALSPSLISTSPLHTIIERLSPSAEEASDGIEVSS